MPLAVHSSIRDNAGQKPFYFASAMAPPTGSVDTTIITPALDRSYLLTDVTVYSYSGTTTGEWQVKLYDGATSYVIYELPSAPSPMYINALCNVPFENPMVVQIRSNFSVAGHYWVSVFGYQWKSGEGVLD